MFEGVFLGAGLFLENSKQITSRLKAGEERSRRARILLADDNPAIVDYVVELLDSEYDVIGAVVDGERVMGETEESRPDVLILDISIGEVNGIELAARLRKQNFAGSIIFLTVHEDQDFLRAAIGAGGSAYVIKSRLDLDLVPAIRGVLIGRLFVSPPLRCDAT
jgi:DNA-binding NarL/FixJ family response regulator